MPEPPSEAGPSRLRLFVFSCLPAILLAAAAETWFRFRPVETRAYETETGFVLPDPDLLWRLAPIAEGPLATNELGFRDLSFRPEARPRVLLVGDSVSWGNGVADVRAVFPQVLENRLAGNTEAWEVINASVPGWSTFQEAEYLRLEGLDLDPDAVVLQFCLNDVVERYAALAELGGDSHFLGVDTRAAARGLDGWLVRNSRAWHALLRGLQRLSLGREALRGRDLARERLEGEVRTAWERMLGELDSAHDHVRDAGLPFVLLIAPYRFQVEEPNTRQPQDRLLAWASAREVSAIDVLEELERLPESTARAAFNDATHFSELGHAVVAELLRPTLLDLLRPGSPRLGPAERWAEAAASLARIGRLDDALDLLSAAEARRPDLPAVHRYRANVRWLAGDRRGAEQSLERLLALEPGDAAARRNLEALRREGSRPRRYDLEAPRPETTPGGS